MYERDASSSFAGFPTGEIDLPVWVVGPPNSAVSADTAMVRNSSRCLPAGEEYEVEGAMACRDDRASAVAAVQLATRLTAQLALPLDPSLLCEFTPRVTKLSPKKVPILYAVGEPAQRQLGLEVADDVPPVEEDVSPVHRAVKALRAEGWEGAIALPSCLSDVCSIVIPRRFAHNGHLLVEHSGRAPGMPQSLVEFTIGLRRHFPMCDELRQLEPGRHLSHGKPLSPRRPSEPSFG
jgi:hypothetical protein